MDTEVTINSVHVIGVSLTSGFNVSEIKNIVL